jgi:hypothetical protein
MVRSSSESLYRRRRPTSTVPRAQRFPIAMRLLWRRPGDPGWADTVTENASRSGVLFHSDQLLMVGTEIELILAFSWEAAPGLAVADVMCRGRIARAATKWVDTPVTILATTIDSYTFIKEPDLQDDPAP